MEASEDRCVSRRGHLYVVMAINSNRVKIGAALGVYVALAKLQAADTDDLQLLGWVPDYEINPAIVGG